jgi:hypothetical protein
LSRSSQLRWMRGSMIGNCATKRPKMIRQRNRGNQNILRSLTSSSQLHEMCFATRNGIKVETIAQSRSRSRRFVGEDYFNSAERFPKRQTKWKSPSPSTKQNIRGEMLLNPFPRLWSKSAVKRFFQLQSENTLMMIDF